MSEGPVLGIDLGTTNSVVAVADGDQAIVIPDADGERLVPSVVSFLPDGHIAVGYEARERRLVDAENTVYAVKRLIGRPYDSPEVARARQRFAFQIVENEHGGSVVRVQRGTYALAEISAMVLKELRRVAERALGTSCERAVITVPANFNELQRSATKAAGKVAGLDVLRIVNEPTAAALAYGYGRGGTERIAVYDLGGGTFDITILELEADVFEVLSTAGDSFLGGEDIDGAVAEAMRDAFREQHGLDPSDDRQAFERLKAAAEWAKCQLSTEEAVELTLEELGQRQGTWLDLTFFMTRAELEELARPWLERSFEVCTRALSDAGLRAQDIDSVVLVGGSTRMPLCRRMVEEHFGKTPRTHLDPDMVVAQGAAIHAFALGGSQEPVAIPRPDRAPGATRSGSRQETALADRPAQPAFAPRQAPVGGGPPPLPGPPSPPQPRESSAVAVAPVVRVESGPSTAPAELPPPSSPLEPFADLVPDDPFGPGAGGLPAAEPGTPFELDLGPLEPAADALPPPRDQRPVRPREPTAPLSAEQHAPPRPGATSVRSREPTVPFSTAAARDPAASVALVMPGQPPPLLMDVTPHSLAIETAGGFCRQIIRKNAPVPCEQTRTFTTAQDDQQEVAVRICQGEIETFEDNEVLGEVVLDELPPGARGTPQIEVTFILDADGTLAVEAKDVVSGRAQRTRISLRGGLSDQEITAMRQRLDQEAS